jgi:hypothetical protein
VHGEVLAWNEPGSKSLGFNSLLTDC